MTLGEMPGWTEDVTLKPALRTISTRTTKGRNIGKVCCTCSPIVNHIVFMLIFTAWLLNSRDSELSFAFPAMIRESLEQSEFMASDTEVRTTFNDISSVEQVYQFLRGPLIDTLFGTQLSSAVGDFDPGWIHSQARMLGAARIRQVRVATNSCAVSQFSVLMPTCYPSLAEGRRRVAPLYGIDLGGGMRRVYRYDKGSIYDLPFTGLGSMYLPGGYEVDVPARRLHAMDLLEQMNRDAYLSIETRALFVDFTLYNANINTFCVVRLAFEMLETGGVVPYTTLRTARLLPYEGSSGSLMIGLDGLIICQVTGMLLVAIYDWRIARKRPNYSCRGYFTRKWVAHEWLTICFFWGVLGMRYYIRRAMTRLALLAPFDPNVHYPLMDVAAAALIENNLQAFEALLVFSKLFKYVAHLPFVRRLAAALSVASRDMSAFVVTFAVLMLSFASTFHLAFGNDLREYRDMGNSVVTLIRWALGERSIDPLLVVNSPIAILVVSLFTFLVYLQFLATVVAVLLRAYRTQPSDASAAWTYLYDLKRQSWQSVQSLTAELRWARDLALQRVGTQASGRQGHANRRTQPSPLVHSRTSVRRNSTAAGDWIREDESFTATDPIQEAVAAFDKVAMSADNAAVTETRVATNQLKQLYFELQDSEQETREQLAHVRRTVLALRDENFAIETALRAQGVHVDTADNRT